MIPLVTFVAGGILATYRTPNLPFRSVILHFAAGVIFSVVGVELLPDIVEKHRPIFVILGFVVGTSTMLLVKKFAEKDENKQKTTNIIPKIPLAFIVAIGVVFFIDGLLLGIGFATGAKAGMLLAFAIALEMFSMGMATAIEMLKEGVKKPTAVKHIVLLSSLFIVSAVLGEHCFSIFQIRGLDLYFLSGFLRCSISLQKNFWWKRIPKRTSQHIPPHSFSASFCF